MIIKSSTKNERHVYWCQNPVDELDFLQACAKQGYLWKTGVLPTKKSHWEEYGEYTCYEVHQDKKIGYAPLNLCLPTEQYPNVFVYKYTKGEALQEFDNPADALNEVVVALLEHYASWTVFTDIFTSHIIQSHCDEHIKNELEWQIEEAIKALKIVTENK